MGIERKGGEREIAGGDARTVGRLRDVPDKRKQGSSESRKPGEALAGGKR